MLQGNRLRSGLLRTALAAGTALAAAPAAHALTAPAPITFEAGSLLGKLTLSGGMDGYGYALTGAGNSGDAYGLLGTGKSAGFEFQNGLIQLQKTSGLVQFTLLAGGNASWTLGTKPGGTSVQTFSTGPFRAAYITIAPNSSFSLSAGQVGSVEGFESGVDWQNPSMLTTDIFYVENSNSVGVSASYTLGPVAATLTFGDGFDTNVWNFLQGSVAVTFNSNNVLTGYFGTNLGHTGPNAHSYGSSTTSWTNSFVGSGPLSGAPFVNSTMFGAYYSYTLGNLNVVPEVQYVYAKQDARVGLPKFSSNFGAAVFASYQFGKSPYSLGGWVQYFTSNGPDNWFLNPGARGFGISIAPTWQQDHLFMRADLGWLHLTNLGAAGAAGYGTTGVGRNQADFILEAGVLF
ncbi:MAG: outer membrane beta-barrel protein [Acetobacteraceae bacterium]